VVSALGWEIVWFISAAVVISTVFVVRAAKNDPRRVERRSGKGSESKEPNIPKPPVTDAEKAEIPKVPLSVREQLRPVQSYAELEAISRLKLRTEPQLEAGNKGRSITTWRGQVSVGSMVAGGVLLLASFALSDAILTLGGIGLAFWGVLFLYIENEPYLKEEAVVSALRGQGATIEELAGSMGSFTQGVHLPPRSISEVAAEKVLLQSTGVGEVAVLAPGLGLVDYYRESANSDFLGVDMDFIRVKLSKALVEDLEVARLFELRSEGDAVTVTTEGSKLYSLCTSMVNTTEAEVRLPCAFHSSFAVVLARATGRPFVLASMTRDPKDKKIVAKYLKLGGERAGVPP
jgi:hypothetical protein